MNMPTRPVADYTPCEQCGHPVALHSERGCHVITDMRAAKHKPNELCCCATIVAEPVEHRG